MNDVDFEPKAIFIWKDSLLKLKHVVTLLGAVFSTSKMVVAVVVFLAIRLLQLNQGETFL